MGDSSLAIRAGAQLAEICFTFCRSSAFWPAILVTLASKIGGSVRIFETWKSEEPGSELIATDLTGHGSVKMGAEGIGISHLRFQISKCEPGMAAQDSADGGEEVSVCEMDVVPPRWPISNLSQFFAVDEPEGDLFDERLLAGWGRRTL